MSVSNEVPNLSLGEIPKLAPRDKTDNEAKSPHRESGSARDEVNMSVSPICMKNGAKVAYVRFAQGDKWAEGVIPRCDIIKSQGYTESECEALENYMKRELKELKKMAAGINVLDAIMGKR